MGCKSVADCDIVGAVKEAVNVPAWKALAAGIGVYFLAKTARRMLSMTVRYSMKGKTVLITGCDSGFGRLLSLRLNAHGAIVLATCLTEKGMADLKASAKFSDNMHPFIMDVTSDSSVAAAFEGPIAKLAPEGLWAVVNNAGVFHGGPLFAAPLSELRKQLAVNVEGVARVDQASLPLLMKQRRKLGPRYLPFGHAAAPCRSRVVTIASVAGEVGAPGSSFYSASKFGVLGMSEVFRRECQGYGVGGSIITPGFTKTNLWQEYTKDEYIEGYLATAKPHVKEFYGEDFFKSMYKHFMRLMILGGSAEAVVDTMEEAVTAVYPCVRYKAGFDAHTLFHLMTVLPWGIQDFLSAAVFGMPRPASVL